ncbi:MAG: DUF417 family protein [Burkholderiaceae bacterium]
MLSKQGATNLIGVGEIATAALLIVGVWSARASGRADVSGHQQLLVQRADLGSELGGFPYLLVVPGQFLLKDLMLLAAALFLLGRSMQLAS